MSTKPKNPYWQQELIFALEKGLSFKSACDYACVTEIMARKHGFKKSDFPDIKPKHTPKPKKEKKPNYDWNMMG